MAGEAFDAIVIGSGQGGNPLARAMAKAGWKTAVVERRFIGGSCVNYGCTPSKTMVASARVAYLARRGAEFGVETGEVQVALETVRARKRKIVASSRANNLKGLVETENLSVILGEARFLGPHTISVALNEGGGTRELTAPKIFLNTGTRTALPQLAGLDDVAFLDSESVMELGSVPEHLIVLGGGYIALEFAQMFRRFGSAVTVLQAGAHLVEQEDADVSDEIAKILREDGIAVLLDAHAERVSSTGEGVLLTVQTPEGVREIAGSHLLVAVGRAPNTEALALDQAGVELDAHGFIQANDRLETTAEGVYVIGDVKGGPQFTHISYDDFRVHRTNLLEGGARSIAGRMVPYTIFIDPELGRVGMNEKQAQAAGKAFRVVKMPMTSMARASESAETRGFLKALVETETDLILGVAALGIEGGELAAQIQIAMMGRLTASALRDGIWSHPTRAEVWNNLFSK